MTLAFLIYSYFPYGGQQRDFLRVARECAARGHEVKVYTMKWHGERPEGIQINIMPVRGLASHVRYRCFAAAVAALLQSQPVDGVVGFNKMPGLDVYFAADPCFAERALKERGFYYRFTPRYRHFSEYERAVFGADSTTHALLLSPLQKRQFAHHYPGCESRLHDIPPGISRDRQPPANVAEIRAQFRSEFGLHDDDLAVLQIGSGFVVKGVDRSLRALAAMPDSVRDRTRYLLVGQDKPNKFKRLAHSLGIADNCTFLSGRDDIPRFLFGCDLLLHPAYSESAGYVLLEATIAGLPVLTTDTCGYAFHITRAGAGEVCSSPFSQADLNRRLLQMLTSDQRSIWHANGIRYGQTVDLYSMPTTVAGLIQTLITARRMREAKS
ncbi:MAG: glycosyltransferase family 4 protein [Gammaproteobacteria bacterium]|nr:glycosyltransferase family 4 protein [Gammaproteobacteria bacterium]MDP2346485.1 glycosyltransferase family 4 protein [Gammaproteobacteria bacterium]